MNDNEALEAYHLLSKLEGIIPAMECSHAIALVCKIAPKMNKNDIVIMCLSGRGDKDVRMVAELEGVKV